MLDSIAHRLNSRFTLAEQGVLSPESDWDYYTIAVKKMPMVLWSITADLMIEHEDGKYSAALWLNPMYNYDADGDEVEMYDQLIGGMKYTSDSSEQDWQNWFAHEGDTPEEALTNLVNFLNDFFPVEAEEFSTSYILEYSSGVKLSFSHVQPITQLLSLLLQPTADSAPVELNVVARPEDRYEKKDPVEHPHWPTWQHPFSPERGSYKVVRVLYEVTWVQGVGNVYKEISRLEAVGFGGNG